MHLHKHAIPCTCHGSQLSRLAILVALFLGVTALGAGTALAQSQGSVGVSPATATFTDPPMLPGGSSQVIINFQQRYTEPVAVDVAVIPGDPTSGQAHEWLTIDRSGKLTLAPGTYPFTITIDVPPGTPNGVYKAGISFDATPPRPTPQEGSSATTETSVTATIHIEIDDENEVKRIKVEGPATLDPTEEGSALRISVPMTNTGNVNVHPHVELEIKDKMQQDVVKTFTLPGALLRPGLTQEQAFVVQQHGLQKGQYWITVTTYLDDEPVHVGEPQPYDVLAPGELARMAELRSIRIEGDLTRVEVNEMVKLTAVVVNVGQGALVAQFEGEVLRDGKVADGLESKAIEIVPGDSANLTMLYRITEPGQYEFKGRAFYGSKVTQEKSVLVSATSETEGIPAIGTVPILAGIVGAAVALSLTRRRI